ncbi:GAF domain-containing protein [Bradyrhizobium sp. LVM 105]|nr:GAF domain-containing protein [Bradyrhizobium sp. LVM 105]
MPRASRHQAGSGMTNSPNNIADELAAENARLRSELAIARDRQSASAEILRTIAASPSDARPVFEAIASSSKRLLGGFSATVLQFIGDELHLVAYTPTSPEADEGLKASFPRKITEFPTFALVRGGETIQFPDSEADDVPELNRDLARLRGFRSVLFMPLMNRGTPVGMISVTRTVTGAFAPDLVQLLQTFADQAVIAIENARLFNETKAALERQTATADILKVMAASPSDVQPVFDAIAANANRLIGGFSTAVLRYADGAAHLAAFTPTDPAGDRVLQASFPVPFAQFPPYGLVANGAAAQLPDTELEPAARDIARARGYRSMLFAPLMSEGEAIGIIIATRRATGAFAEHHVRLLQTFADQAVIAIKNVSLFNEVASRTGELAKSLDDLRAAQDRLVQTEKLASLGQLTAGIAHEIKNPLNFVNNFASVSAELTDELNEVLAPVSLAADIRAEVDELTGLLKDNLGKVVQHGRRADSIVKNMLLHSREGGGEHRISDINAVVEESLTLAYHGARAEQPQFDVTLERDLDPAAGSADVFPQEITRVLLNLIGNGFHAVAKRKAESEAAGYEPVVTAATRDRGDQVEIRIRDNGTGIPDEVKEKMFNPFFTTKPAGEGTGLGLSMSHDIVVKQHGGTIDVATKPGEFSEFTILLPRKSSLPDGAG